MTVIRRRPPKMTDPDITARRHGGDEFSVAAHGSIAEFKVHLRNRVLDFIARQPDGATCEEVEVALGLSHQSCSARIAELRRDGAVHADGRRPTRSGRSARVHVVWSL